MESLMILCVGAMCCVCFVLGAGVVRKVSKGEDSKRPNMAAFDNAKQERRAGKEEAPARSPMDIILQNINSYDGTGSNQEDVPGR